LNLSTKFISYAISFAVIALYWNGHRRMIRHIRHFDDTFIWLIMLFLFFVAFLPVPTSFIGVYYNAPSIIIFYALSLTICGLVSFIMWFYAIRNHRLVDAELEQQVIQTGVYCSLIPPIIFVLSLSVLLAPGGAQYVSYFWWLIPVAFKLVGYLFRRNNLVVVQASEHPND